MENQECWKSGWGNGWTLTGYKMLGGRHRPENSRLLPIIISIEEVEITDTYHNIWELTRIGDNMAVS